MKNKIEQPTKIEEEVFYLSCNREGRKVQPHKIYAVNKFRGVKVQCLNCFNRVDRFRNFKDLKNNQKLKRRKNKHG